MTAPATLGRGLVRAIVFATLIGMAMFGVITTIVIYIAELHEKCPCDVNRPGPVYVDDPPIVIIKEVGAALAFAAPVGIGLSLLIGRGMTRTTTKRLDQVLGSARAMRGERLEERLPVSPANDALDRLSVALNGVLERIETGVAEQRQFAANASHELRTPLTLISTNLEVARRKPRDAMHWEHVADDTLAEVRRMTNLVDKLLVLSRAGAAGLNHERRDLRALASAALDRAGGLAAERELELAVMPGSAVFADVDPEAIAIVFDNLLRNAIDHSPPGTRIEIVVEAAPHPRIVVADRGPGVPEDLRQRIFEPFARGHHSSDRTAGPGFGLGLAICKRIVEGHGGTIAVDARPGGGARFSVELAASAS